MTVRMKVVAVVGAAGVLLALPVGAQAKSKTKSHSKSHSITKTVDMGLPLKNQKKFGGIPADVNDFFPHGTTIHVGDKIRFVPTGFHTLDLPPRGAGAIALIAPNGTTVTGAPGLDAAGTPFWFDNNPQVQNVGFNPLLLKFTFGKKFSYGGKTRVESGLPVLPQSKLKPITVKFTKKGTFTFYCDIHPGMKGVVHVEGRRSKIPSKKSDGRALKRQVTRDFNTAKGLAATPVPAGTIDVGVAGPHGVEYYGFAPGTFSAHVGDKLTFRMSPGTFEDHTATTGPGDPNADPTAPGNYLGALAASITGSPVIDPRAAFPSENPASPPASLTPTLHGNGFWNSGVMQAAGTGSPLPDSNSVTFGAAGTYQFYCLIHPFMHFTVTVT